MKELYDQIHTFLENNRDGWATPEKVGVLVGAVLAMRPETICEIGIWNGRSFLPMAMALKAIKSKGRIIGIDPWNKDASAEEMTGENQKWWAEADHERIFKQFTDNLVLLGVAPWTQVHRCKSDEYKITDELAIDILSIDGNHGEFASTYDVTHFAPHVRLGGLLWMDDVGWAEKANAMIPVLGFHPLYNLETGTMYQRLKIP